MSRTQFSLKTMLWLMVAIALTSLTVRKLYEGGTAIGELVVLSAVALFFWAVYVPGFFPTRWR